MRHPTLCPTCKQPGERDRIANDTRDVRYCPRCRTAWFPDDHRRPVAVPDLPERKDLA